MEATKQQRVEEFFRRLREAETAGSGEEAPALVERILNEVEDEMTLTKSVWRTDYTKSV